MFKLTRELMEMFGTKNRPISLMEFREFWISLSSPEKQYYLRNRH